DHHMLTRGEDRLGGPGDGLDVLAADAPVLLHEIGHGVVDADKLGAGDARRPRLFRAAAVEHGVVFAEEFGHGLVHADIDAAEEGDALALHLLDATVDIALLDLEIGDAVAHQPAGAALALIDMNIVPGTAELLCR